MAIDDWVRFGSRPWWILLAVVVLGRAADLFSTWVASPNLVNEGNPVARRLGWRRGILLQSVLAPFCALWPALAISLATMSVLVAARNFQHAWLMRSMGEGHYRVWFFERVMDAPPRLVRGCYLAEAGLAGMVGAVLVWASGMQLIPASIGAGICGYATAVAVFTTLSFWRLGR